ncbi:MAG TPA: cytochrome c oxidase assembly factor Coa1 family protein [Myxococcaceae bacterium]|nr:cytochrome c oxidase assembly factor Coa1 family protein [Myxococcaceae bacterium]
MDQTIPQGGWWSRNWKWFVPVGCLSILATCGCCIGGIWFTSSTAVSRSRAYQEALTRAKANPEIQQALGTPIATGWITQTGIEMSGGVTQVGAHVALNGPKGEGTLIFSAVEHDKEITFQQLDVVVGHQAFHLAGAVEEGGEKKGDVDIDRPDVTVEAATNRPGGDYRDYEMADPDASKCALDCAGDAECKAYTFVKPSGGKPGRCRLKNRPAAKVASDCCVSGVKK